MAASRNLTPEQRRQRATAAALARWAKEDPTAQALKGQRGLLARFEREVDPDGILAPVERTRRAQLARRAYMASLALKSSIARTKAS